MLSWLSLLSTRRFILCSSLVILAAITIISGYRLYALTQLDRAVTTEIQLHDDAITLQELRYHTVQIQQYLTDASLTGDKDAIDDAKAHQLATKPLLQTLSRLELGSLTTLMAQQVDVGEKMVAAYSSGDKAAGDRLMKHSQTGFDALSSAINEQVEQALTQQSGRMEASQQLAEEHQKSIQRGELGSALLLLLLVLTALFLIHIKINRPLTQLLVQLRDLTTGEKNLGFRLPEVGRDEFTLVASTFNRFLSDLDHILGTVQQVSHRSSQQMANLMDRSKATLQGMNQVQTNTDALAAATQEMSSTVQEIAYTTEQAKQETEMAQEQAADGQRQVGDAVNLIRKVASEIEQAVAGINQLDQQSNQIGDILNVIRTISEQTNLLALNAAIEAARAGEAGRGFAVVADEVRHLASRTQQATVEIQQRIQQLQQSTTDAVDIMHHTAQISDLAVEQAEAAGSRLNEIVQAVSRITDMNMQIATAAEQQSLVAQETSRNVVDVADIARGARDDANASFRFAREVNFGAQEVGMLTNQFSVSQDEQGGENYSSSEVVRWSDAFKVGVRQVDEQHYGLFQSMNSLYEAIHDEAAASLIQQRLDTLVQLAKQHLNDEEKLMQQAGYRDLGEHKLVHQKLLADLDKLLQRFRAKEADIEIEVVFFLKNWLVGHIFSVDKRYVPEFHAAGIR
ncbi:MAG: bacteriohemerythrin [Aeromonadaceae bacterium]